MRGEDFFEFHLGVREIGPLEIVLKTTNPPFDCGPDPRRNQGFYGRAKKTFHRVDHGLFAQNQFRFLNARPKANGIHFSFSVRIDDLI
jgi:hypothetical protein